MERTLSLQRRDFRRWLKHHKPDDIIGTSCSVFDCPIARFVRDQFPQETHAKVNQYHVTAELAYRIQTNEEYFAIRRNSPKWVKKFISLADRVTTSYEISADEALGMLDQVELPISA